MKGIIEAARRLIATGKSIWRAGY